MNRKIIKLYFDSSGRPVTSGGLELDPADYPVLHTREQFVVHCLTVRIAEADGAVTVTPRPLDPGADFRLAASENRSGAVMFVSDLVNREGDWDDEGTADCAAGELSFLVSTDTGEFAAAAALDGLREYTLRLLAYSADEELPSILGQVEFTPVIVPDFSRPAPESVTPEYLDYAGVLALARAPYRMEFSIDGEEHWHPDQGELDRFCRFAKAGGEAWSAPVRLPGGSGFRIEKFGTFAERDSKLSLLLQGMVYYATDTRLVYLHDGQSWSEGFPLVGGTVFDRRVAAAPVRLRDGVGPCHALGAGLPPVSWLYRAEGVLQVELTLIPTDADAVIVPEVDGAAQLPWRIPAATARLIFAIPAPGWSGRLRLLRGDDLYQGEIVITQLGCSCRPPA